MRQVGPGRPCVPPPLARFRNRVCTLAPRLWIGIQPPDRVDNPAIGQRMTRRAEYLPEPGLGEPTHAGLIRRLARGAKIGDPEVSVGHEARGRHQFSTESLRASLTQHSAADLKRRTVPGESQVADYPPV